MTIPSPNLDDRDFAKLTADARAFIEKHRPRWTDLSPGDPGITLVELFAYLTDQMVYRLNQVPRKAYIEFLRMIGLTLRPPAAATVSLRFEWEKATEEEIVVPRGTRVAVDRSGGGREPPVFTTSADATIPIGSTSIEIQAHQCDIVEAELAPPGTGLPGQVVMAQRPPIISPTGDRLDLIVGVELKRGDKRGARDDGIPYGDKTYRIWQEVEDFVDQKPGATVYVADRMDGLIQFAPAVRTPDEDGELSEAPVGLAGAPGPGREIRLWYRRGGGADGNVAAGTIKVLKDPIGGLKGVKVTNPAPATGGRDAESLENALVRGPQEIHAVSRAVTAEDYEAIATKSGAISRARAYTKAALWKFAQPGTVDVLLVPYLSDEEQGTGLVPVETIEAHQTDTAREQIQAALDERRPLGTTCNVGWAHYKTVKVSARVVVRREEKRDEVEQRVKQRLYQTITPLQTKTNPSGWRFGQALRVSNVFDMILKEPGVRFADNVILTVDEAPNAAVAPTVIARDSGQAQTWYTGGGETLFRSLNDGRGWEVAGRFAGETIKRVRAHDQRPGWLAVSTWVVPPDDKGKHASRIYVSQDAGESWEEPVPLDWEVEDVAWMDRGATPLLLIASDNGLHQMTWDPRGTPVQVAVVPENQGLGFYSVAVATSSRDGVSVAVAGQGKTGVFLSSGTDLSAFRQIRPAGEAIQVLAIQYDGPRAFLWAGTVSDREDDPGKGCYRWELRGAVDPPEGWKVFSSGWQAGSCWGLAFVDRQVYAATHHGGVLRLDSSRESNAWEGAGVKGGLPIRDLKKAWFEVLKDVAAGPGESGDVVMTVCTTSKKADGKDAAGVYASRDGAVDFLDASQTESDQLVTLPKTWLFASGEHTIAVASEDEVSG